ncbi:MAG: ACP S-malonyltransferase [Candidatus Atribacteria bacterium]|nr:ACP S-malonyltransferase [Candidatus Atribacteria bacterium]
MDLVYLFPGQGSQKVGMVDSFLEFHPKQTHALFEEANERCGTDLLRLSHQGPEDELNLTANAQPAILTMSVLIQRLLSQEAPSLGPRVVAGHSLGEYSALVCAGSLSFVDAVALVRKRGEIMQRSVPVGIGTMVALIGLPLVKIENLVKELSREGIIEVANYNSSEQTVLSLQKTLLEKTIERAKSLGARKVVELRVSVPFHSSFMRDAATEFKELLIQTTFRKPSVRYMSNVTADDLDDAENIRFLLSRQMVSPVRWKDIITRFVQEGYNHYVEIGPGSVLSRMLQREYDGVSVSSIDSEKSLHQFVKEVEFHDQL